MFYTGLWYKNSEEEECILRNKLSELIEQKKLIQNEISIENMTDRGGTSTSADEEYQRKRKKMDELSSKVIILTTALKQMQFSLNSSNNLAPNRKQSRLSIDSIPPLVSQSAYLQQMEAQKALQQFMVKVKAETTPSKQTLASALPSMSNHISPRIQSSNYHLNHFEISCLNERYEKELDVLRKRCERRLRTSVNHRIYHIEPDLSQKERCKKTDDQKLKEDENGFFTEHIWKETIDEALESYIDGDILQLAEGRHIVNGKHIIYGTLTVRGMASSNWKTLIINKYDSDHFIWCSGKNARVTFENCLIHRGIVRVSLRSQFIGKKVIFHCNTLEGICIEHSSKLWLDECVILNSVGAAIHINTGCKCLLTQTSIVNCGEGDYEIAHGQGAIVIYGSDINYAEHLVRRTPSLRFPSMDNVPAMVLDPDPTLAAMLRGRTYLYVQECKIKSNCGFGIAFEVAKNFHPLPVPIIASMMDISITVRETHFTENSFGNMGKIPAVWIQHANKDGLFLRIKRINPALFGDVIVEDFEAIEHEMNDNEEEEEENEEGEVEGDDNILPLTAQALRAHSASMSDRYDSDNGSVQIIEPPSSRRLKSEIGVVANTNNQITDVLDQNDANNPIVIEDEETTVSIKLSEQKEEGEQTVEMRTNSSQKTLKTVEDGEAAPATPPLAPQNIKKVNEDLNDPNQGVADISVFKKRIFNEDKIKCDESEDLSIAVDKNTNLQETEIENNGNDQQLLLRRSSRIKDKQQKDPSNDLQISIIPNQPKTKKAVTKKVKSQSPSPSTTTKTKKRRRLGNKKKTKQNKVNSNDIDDDKENENANENPRKRRKLNETAVGAKNNKFVSDECKENESENDEGMRFPIRRIVEEDEDDSDVAISDKVIAPTPKKTELRRSTRKASIRATKNLLKEKPKRNSHQKKRKVALSQKITSNNKRNKKPRRKRRNSTNSKRA